MLSACINPLILGLLNGIVTRAPLPINSVTAPSLTVVIVDHQTGCWICTFPKISLNTLKYYDSSFVSQSSGQLTQLTDQLTQLQQATVDKERTQQAQFNVRFIANKTQSHNTLCSPHRSWSHDISKSW